MKQLFFACLLLLALPLAAQKARLIDSLLKRTDDALPDTVRMQAFYQLGRNYIDNNSAKSIEYFQKAKAIALENNALLIVANCFYSIGHCYHLQLEFDKSLSSYLQSEKYYVRLKDTFRLSNALMAIGNVYQDYKNIAKKREYYTRAEVLVKQTDDTLQLSNIYSERGLMFDQEHQYDSALVYINKGYALQLLIADSNYAYSSLSNLGLTYKHMARYGEAIRCFDSVISFYNRNNFAAFYKGIVYNNIGATYAKWGKPDLAMAAFNSSLDFAKQAQATSTEMENYRNMADMFGFMKDYQKQLGYLTKYYSLKDSVYNIESQNRVTQLEADYQIERKNSELVKQEAELVRQKSQRNFFITLAAAVAAVLVLLLFFYNRIQKSNNELKEKNSQISDQAAQLQNLNQVKDRLFSIISHDLRNPLATLRSYLTLAGDEAISPEKKQAYRQQTINTVSSTSDMLDNLLAWANVQIKNVNTSITPINIEECVGDVVHDVNAQAEQKGITILQELGVGSALGNYDILAIALRNIITNAVKFSNPSASIHIRSAAKNGHVLLTVEDQGNGISKAQVENILSGANSSTPGTAGEKGSGLGLFLSMELLQKMNAELLIDSEEGAGSKFIIVLQKL